MRLRCLQKFSFVSIFSFKKRALTHLDLFAAVNCQVTPVRDVYMDSSVKTVDAGNTGQAFIYDKACSSLIPRPQLRSSDFEPSL